MASSVPICVVLPLLVAALVQILGRVLNRRWLDLVTIATAAAVTVLDFLLLIQAQRGLIVYWFGGWTPEHGFALGICLAVDSFGAALACLTGLLTLAGLIFTWRYFEALGTFFHSLMLIFMSAMTGFCLTGDLFNLFVFFELMGVTAYALTGYKIEDTGPLEGALNFSVMNSLGAILVLAGIALIYGRTGSLNMAQAGQTLALGPADPLLLTALGLLLTGFFVKAAIVPFHFWLPDAHAVAPTAVSVLFSGIMVELGLYAAARVYLVVFSGALGGHEAPVRDLLITLGGITAVLGAVMCVLQRHLKRLLAFSTVSHAGLILAGIALPGSLALSGSLIYLLGHGLVKGALFLIVGILLHRRRSVDEINLQGRCGELKIAGILFILAGLALAGLPPFGTFLGKAMLEQAAGEAGSAWLTVVAIVISALTGGAVLRAGAGMFLGWGRYGELLSAAPSTGDLELPETVRPSAWTPVTMWGPAAALIGLALALGLMPGVSTWGGSTAAKFLDVPAYRNVVLEGIKTAPVGAMPFSLRLESYELGLLAVALAMLSAAGELAGGKEPKILRKLRRSLATGPVKLLRGIHSGYVGDYVAWFMAGAFVLAAVMLLAGR